MHDSGERFRISPTFTLYIPSAVSFIHSFSQDSAMQKTKKSIAKRFKITGSGKLLRRSPGMRHLLSSKSRKQKRRLSQAKLVSESRADSLKRAMPFGS